MVTLRGEIIKSNFVPSVVLALEPQPPERWTKTLDCTNEAQPPLQHDPVFHKESGVEDCLYINVFTKDVKPPIAKPVMIWIYGGAFQMGGSSKIMYSPDYLMNKGVVFVSFNYRVGAFGFLSLKDPTLKVPGNAGLKDQVMAIKWVKENIERFGGDPDNITVFGQSAGGTSTHYMLLTEQTKGLFHKAIVMSGTGHMYWAVSPDNNFTHRLAKKVGYKGEETDAKILEFLRKANGSAVSRESANLLTPEEKDERLNFALGPVIEPYVTEQCIVPKHPRLMARETWSNAIPILLGGTSFEGLLSYPKVKADMSILKKLNDCEYLVPNDLNLDRNSEQCKEFGRRLKTEYFGDKEATLLTYLDLCSYKSNWHGLHRTTMARLKYARAHTYLYRFDFDSKDYNHLRNFLCGKDVRGVCHGDELVYMFENMFGHQDYPGTKEYEVIQQFVGMLSAFAYKSDPNFVGIKPTVWLPVSKDDDQLKCLNISDQLTFGNLPENERLKIWDSMYEEDTLI